MHNAVLAKWDHLCKGKNIQEKKKFSHTPSAQRSYTKTSFIPSYVRSYFSEELKMNSQGQQMSNSTISAEFYFLDFTHI